MQKEVIQRVGKKITFYRKAQNLTLDELGRRIYKNRSTVWKYENGDIQMDLGTLLDIAEALKISLSQLFAAPVETADESKMTEMVEYMNFFMYMFDGRNKRMTHSCAKIAESPTETARDCIIYYDINSYKHPQKCYKIYTGQARMEKVYFNFSMFCINNSHERLNLITKESFNHQGIYLGLLQSVLLDNYQPCCTKVILSKNELEDELLIPLLRIGTDDVASLKKLNFFCMPDVPTLEL